RDAGRGPGRRRDRAAAAARRHQPAHRVQPVPGVGRPATAGVAADAHLRAVRHRGRQHRLTGVPASLGGRLRADRPHRTVEPRGPTRLTAGAAMTGEGFRVLGLDAYYGEYLAVQDVSLTIDPYTVTAFIGPSGCGKSTVLRTLNRLHEMIPGARVSGEILFD